MFFFLRMALAALMCRPFEIHVCAGVPETISFALALIAMAHTHTCYEQESLVDAQNAPHLHSSEMLCMQIASLPDGAQSGTANNYEHNKLINII